MKNHYLKVVIGSILMLITAGSFNFQSDKSLYLIDLENSETPKSLEFNEIKEVAVSSPVAIEKEELPETFFASNEGEGQIGVSDDKPLDNPIDNIFHVNIEEKLRGNENIWLEYELKGVQDYSGISRSINDQLSVGGYLVKKSDDWVMQKELINPNDLKLGDNVIRFTIADNNDYGYQIRNLGIRIEPYSEVQSISNRRLVVNQPSTEYYYGKLGYFQGLIIGDDSEKAKVLVNGEKIRYQKGTFESLVEKPINSSENWTVRVQAIFPDGQELYVDVPFNKPSEWDYKNGFDKEIHSTEQLVSNSESFELQLANAKLKGDSGCIDRETKFSITALRDIDVPALDAGMINVTAGFKGYRFLPHGTQFKENVFVELAYDTTKIPQGYTAHDIKTYFFDENSHHWVALPKDSLLLAENTVKSITYHFTDMINGIIKVPESPETQGYTPTSMKDVKAANPATGINLIAPPTANSMGSANLSYPLNIPAGRQGMQPQLAISYSSGGGNGWLGLGWDLSVPSISVDTRWGVPYFDPNDESETYLMSGEQLSPVAHRSDWIPRDNSEDATKQFYPRVEGSFNKTIRHGGSPQTYWWEITDKSGIKYYYGASSTSNGIINSAVLKDLQGNIVKWALVEIRDLNENFIKYNYTIVEDAGIIGGTVPGYQIYLDKITYTGYGAEEGVYSVEFIRDRQEYGADFDDNKRNDVTINGRYGFKEVTADKLTKVIVSIADTVIRSYKLDYYNGAYSKTLFSKITEFDSKNNEFNSHVFSYYTNPSNALGGNEIWNTQNDYLDAGLELSGVDFEDQASVLESNINSSDGTNFIATTTFILTSNGNGTNNKDNKNRGFVKLIDMNGDGLPDKLFRNGDDLFYRPQIKSSEVTQFGIPSPILGDVNNFLLEEGTTDEFVFEFKSFPGGPTTGLNVSGSTSKTKTYMADVNADGFIDIVKNGVVYYNHCNQNGDIEFIPTSLGTPNQISEEGTVLESIEDAIIEKLTDLIEFNPLYDAVKYWQAPFDGTITIDAPVQLYPTSETGGDGVYVSIQQNSTELWRDSIQAEELGIVNPQDVQNLPVQKGDQFYFRVQTKDNGKGDVVSWNPEIKYNDKDDQLLDPNNKKVYTFNSAEDFLLSSENKISLPFKGSVSVKSKLTKPFLSDDIDIIVLKNKEVFSSKHLDWNEQFNDSLNWDIDVNENDTLEFLVNSESNVRWEDISWYPSLKYNYVEDDNIVIDENEVVNVVPQFSVYPNVLNVAQKYTSNFSETIKIIPYLNKLSGNYNINFTVKSYNNLLYSSELEINDSLIADTIELILDQSNDIYFEFFSKDLDFAKQITASGVTVINSASVKDIGAGLYSSAEEDKKIFGCLYRNWGQFVYDGSDEREYSPINEIYLVPVTEEQLNAQIDKIKEWLDNFDENGEIPTDLDMEQIFIPMAAFSETNTYKGLRSRSTISANLFTSSRLRPESVTQTPEGINKRAITKFNKSLIETKHGGIDLIITNPDKSKSRGFSKTFSNFMDINGDRYPDIVTSELIQFSNQNGDLSDKISLVDEEYINFTTLNSEGESIGTSIAGNSSQIKQASNSSSKSSFSLGISFGISGSVGEGSNNQTYSWFDINGDGLPDKLYGNGMVALNFGYSFGEPELWNFTDIRKEESTSKNGSVSGGLSAGYKFFSIGGTAGAGISRSDNSVSRQFSDINNDGLVDIVLISDNKINVKYNTGNGFTTERNWINGSDLGKSVSVSQYDNYGGSFSVGFGMFQETISELDVGIDGIHRIETSIEDVDGDGFADYLQSNTDDKLVVRRSNIAKTNLLRAVQRPLNATIALDYEIVGNTFDMPHARQVLSSVTVIDGHYGDGADKMLTTFEYTNGKYDRREREFYGFEKVKSNQIDSENNNATYRSVIKEYTNDNYYTKGLLTSETIQDANEKIFVKSENTFVLKDRSMDDLPNYFEDDGNIIAFPALIETNKYFYEGGTQAQKSTKMTFAYGNYGNIVAYTDSGDSDITDDNISSTIDYWGNLTDKNVLSVPKSIVVTGGDGNTYRKRETSIDDDGKITQIRQYLKAGQPATFDLFYNDYGNLDSVIRPANYNGDRMYFAYDYDNVVHSYITNVMDAYGYSSSTTYDYRFGQIKSTTDINGQQTLYEIDDLGRITEITGPYELESGQDYTLRFAYHPDATTPWAHTQHYDPAHPENPIETALFIDGLGRVLQTKKDGVIFNVLEAKDEEVMLVSGKVVFDAFGRAVQSYYPLKESKGSIGKFNSSVDGITPTKVSYDILDRTKTSILPDIATTTITYGFGKDRLGNLQFMTTVKDAEMNKTISYKNIKGLQTAIKAPGNVWTSFVYNSINELKDVTDAEDNITVSEYDMFGRRISRDHPDAGLTEYTYDISGNMLTQTTANLRKEKMEITYEYDYSRLSNINYPQNSENNVRFEYGESGADYNRAGRIVVQEDATGAQEFFYGNLGEITKNIRTIIVPDDGIFTFVTEWEYDTWNRLTSMIYPDDEEL
ncbi:MAG: hypothetical protein GQ564_23330, partial [Bacteroidales bacterium]|nr:hypothetical protein [Bacteroidales bacterium]